MNIHIFHQRTIVAKALSQLLQNEGYQVFLRHQSVRLQKEKKLQSPSLLIIDIDPLVKTRAYQASSSWNTAINILLLGRLEQLNWLFKFPSNPIGFVCKTDTLEDLYQGIEELKDGKTFISYQARDLLNERELVRQRILFEKNVTRPLTKTELKIMLDIGRGETSNQIAEGWCRSLHTINNHRKNIKKKLSSKDLFKLSHFCYQKKDAIETLIALNNNSKLIINLIKND